MEWYDLSDVQAQAILDMQLRRIAALEREKIESEYKELQATIRDLEGLLADPKKVDAEIKKETIALKRKHGSERRTVIGEDARDFRREDLEPHEQIVITLSQGGYVKRIPASTYRNQHRGGKGVVSMATREDDPVEHILVCDTHDTLLFFTNTGRVLPLKSYELRADTSRNSRGVPVVNVIPLTDREHVNAVVAVPDLGVEGRYLVLATRKGLVKRVTVDQIFNVRRAGLIIMNLRDNDELVTARLATEEDDVIMVTRQGQSIRFALSEITPRLRAAGGVKGMDLRARDVVIAMDVVVPDSKLLVISRKGYGKLTDPQPVPCPGARRPGRQDAEGDEEDRTGRRRAGDHGQRRALPGLFEGQGASNESLRDPQHGPGGAGRHDIQAGRGRLGGLDSVRGRAGDS